MKSPFILICYLFIFTFPVVFPAKAFNKESFSFNFSHITSENGLSQSNVKAIIQDSYGFIWFGTKNGLNRYDGNRMVIMKCDDHLLGKGNHNIAALCEDNNRCLWVGTDEGVYIYNPVKEEFRFVDHLTPEGTQMNNWVADIQKDNAGNIWIVIPTQGIFLYKNEQLIHHSVTDPEQYRNKNPQCICICPNDDIWVGTYNDGLYQYDRDKDTFIQYITDSRGNSVANEHIYSICDYDDHIAIAVHHGELKKFHKTDHQFSLINSPSVHHTLLRKVVYLDNELWVGTQEGLFIINEEENKTIHVEYDPRYPYGLSDKTIYSIFRDKQDGIWIGTNFGGVNYLSHRKIFFDKYIPLKTTTSLSSKHIRELLEDKNGNIWIGTEDEGFNLLNPATGNIRQFKRGENSRNNNLITLTLFDNQDEIWCGLFKNGMDVIRLSDYSIKHHPHTDLQLEEESIYAIYKDSTGRLWLGNDGGVYLYDEPEKKFVRIPEIWSCWIFDITEDNQNRIWFTSMGSGVFRYDPAKDEYRHYLNDPSDSSSLSSNSVSGVMSDSRGNIWLSTDRGGICRYNPEKDNFTIFSIEQGLPDNVAYSILEDKESNLWFGTNQGLVRFNPETHKIRVFTKEDGLLGNQFNYKSALKASDGKFYFGGVDGLISFYPGTETSFEFIPPVYITRLKIFNEEVTVGQPVYEFNLENSILFTEQIRLPHNRSNFSLDFVALDYAAPESYQYLYKMDGIDKEWIIAPGSRSVFYTQLPPGQYTFRIKAINNDANWLENETTLNIRIYPPWWLSVWAYISYIFLFFCMAGGIMIWYKRRRDRKMEEARKLYEIEKEKELYSAKVEFFTEIAHEVKTPLTLINGPLETIMEMDIPDEKMKKNLEVISSNTNRLLQLTKQLLDFRKVEANKFLMDFMMTDIPGLLRDIAGRFEPTYIKEKKELKLILPDDTFSAAIDKEGVTKIISNLLNNGLKYSQQKVCVELKQEQTAFTLMVTSDGEKIRRELSQQIFEPFYQANKHEASASGAGIGLALSRSLAELHSGRLYLDTNAGENTFILTLPLNQEKMIHLEEYSIHDEYVREEEQTEEKEIPSYSLLLVEDNPTILSFLGSKLAETFQVIRAANGAEAWELLQQHPVHIIVSDIMMPVMDGMELCRKIKSEVDHCHIPFVFVTAKEDINSKIDGLKAGAEAYIEKPFSFNHLKTQILSLLENRRKEREAFSQKPFFPVHNLHVSKPDEEFMNRIIEIIKENLTDENFSVERLADIVCMSRSNLLRKIKMLSGLPPVDFIKLIRLKRSAELIIEGRYRIGEICYMVGINSPSYFSQLFQKQFGKTPKEFEKENRSQKPL